MTDEATAEYEPTKWVRLKHSRTYVNADGASSTLHWSVESHDDIRATSTLRHAIVQTVAAHRYADAGGEATPAPSDDETPITDPPS